MKEQEVLKNTIINLWKQRYPETEISEQDIKDLSIKTVDIITVMLEWKFRKSQIDEIKTKYEKKVEKKPVETKEEMPTGKRLIPVTKWNDYYDYPKIGGLRSLIFYEKTNGFDKVIRRIGRRVLIKEDEFFKWIEENNP